MRYLASLAALVLVTAACGGDRPSLWMGGASAELPAGVPAERLPEGGSRGARLVAEYCSACHGIPTPARHSAEEWRSIARRMFRRMEHMGSMPGMMRRMHRGMPEVVVPSAEERRAILAYLQRHALATLDEEELEGSGEPVALFARTCSRCHALPDPGQHVPEDWPEVVDRMRQNMRRMDVSGISDEETATIVSYLQQHAGPEGGSDDQS